MRKLFNPLSQTSYIIRPFFNEIELSVATCFFIKRNGKLYLITNWHIVSGRNPQNNKCLSKTCAIPNKLKVRIHKNQDIIDFIEIDISLYDQFEEPTWLEHPVYKFSVDVVALEVTLPETARVFDVERFIEPCNEDTEESVSNDVFILGYPFGLSVESLFPIWKRASIASEPCVNIDGLPKLLVDTATKQGMSGSPVILIEKRGAGVAKSIEDFNKGLFSKNKMKFVGVYSGRIGVDERNIEAQLGIVWKQEVIDEIIFQEALRHE